MLLLIFTLIIIVLANVGDYWSTKKALKHGAREANPIVNAVGLGEAKIGGIVVLSWLALLFRDEHWFLWGISLIVGITYAYVIWNNLKYAR